jgi:hypothetical protein
MVHSANGHRTRKGGNGGAPPDLDTTALALHSTSDRTFTSWLFSDQGCAPSRAFLLRVKVPPHPRRGDA